MKEENEITEEVKQLLDSLEQHGRNARRQKELCNLIDSLEAGTGTSLQGAELAERRGNDAKRRKLYPIWWIIGAAAACLLLWLLVKPTKMETPNVNEEILVEQTDTIETKNIQQEDIIQEDPVILEDPITTKHLLAEETPVKPKKTTTKPAKPTQETTKEVMEAPSLADNTPVEPMMTDPTDTSNSESNPIPNLIEEHLSPPTSPQRRVIRSLNLVCYECQNEPEYTPDPSLLTPNSEKTIFGQPQDPNMKNGSLAFELKLQ